MIHEIPRTYDTSSTSECSARHKRVRGIDQHQFWSRLVQTPGLTPSFYYTVQELVHDYSNYTRNDTSTFRNT